MANENRLGKKIKALRKAEGWSVHDCCKMMTTVKPYSLYRIESGETRPWKMEVSTMLQLVDLFWPDLELADFLPPHEIFAGDIYFTVGG